MPYPHSASSPPSTKKAGLCLFVVAEVWRGLSKCGRWGRRVLAPTLCDRHRASLHVYERFVGFASCLVSRLGCHIVWQLSAADFKHPCLKLWASTITHPCVCGRWGRRILARPAQCEFAPSTKKSRAMPVCGSGSVAGCRIAVIWVAASCSDFVQPLSCILCTFMNALLVSHHCLFSHLGCHIVWQLSAADFKHPCLKLWAFIL